MAALALGAETRFKAAIVIAGGLQSNCRSLPEADELNFAPPAPRIAGASARQPAW